MKALMLALLAEDSRVSMMRLMSLLALLIGAAIAVYGLAVDCDNLAGIAELVAIFVGAAFTGKVAQKFAESKQNKEEGQEDEQAK